MDGDVVSEWRIAAGGQIESQGHGLVDLGWRRGRLSIELFTETLDLRYRAALSRGRITFGVRGTAAASGMWITPWADGAPDLSRAQLAQAVGPDVRVEAWGPSGSWVAFEGFARYHAFSALGDSTLVVADTPWARASASAGVWKADGRAARITGGVDVTSTVAVPFVNGEAALTTGGRVAPFASLHAGWAEGADDVVATRLGGLTPYHVPFAGAAWAEFWVEDYVVSRVGAELRADPVRFCAAMDAGAWTYPDATTLPTPPARQGGVGFTAGAAWHHRGWFAEVAGAASPTLPRQDGVSRLSLFAAVGTTWRSAHGPERVPERPCAL